MPLEQIETELRVRARELIQRGQLPAACSDRTWGGPGCANACSLCNEIITPDEIEYEVEGTRGEHVRLRFHPVCHAAWQMECARIAN
jgi:hypothetical protein